MSRRNAHCTLFPLALGLAALMGIGCPGEDADPGGKPACTYAGKAHRLGERFPSEDGCNSCACEAPGQIACTLIACLSDAGRDSAGDASGVAGAGGKTTTSSGGISGTGGSVGSGGSSPDGGIKVDADGASTDSRTCRRTGCSGQLCSDEQVGSTCEYRPEYACYQSAICERQADGKCGFTRSDALTRCLGHGGLTDGGSTDASGDCALASTYDYGFIGGLVAYTERSYLTPRNQYRHVRIPSARAGGGPDLTCAVPLPECGANQGITAHEIESTLLTEAAVRAALAEPTTPLFGADNRPVDGVVFEFKAGAGKSILVGNDCQSRSGCRPIPPGIQELRDRLLALDKQQLATATCKAAGFTQ